MMCQMVAAGLGVAAGDGVGVLVERCLDAAVVEPAGHGDERDEQDETRHRMVHRNSGRRRPESTKWQSNHDA